VGHAELADPAGCALLLEPRQMLAPEHEVVNLLDLDATEPVQLAVELRSTLLHGVGPDLGRDRRFVAPAVDRCTERALGPAVHRRGVEQPHPRLERRADDFAGQLRVAAERVPRAEPDHRPQPALVHQRTRLRASLPAA
jgi:hypothetical protein